MGTLQQVTRAQRDHETTDFLRAVLRDMCRCIVCNSFMAVASRASAPAAERIVGVAEVPLRPFWVLTYQHGARRAACQRTRLYLLCPSELRQRVVQPTSNTFVSQTEDLKDCLPPER